MNQDNVLKEEDFRNETSRYNLHRCLFEALLYSKENLRDRGSVISSAFFKNLNIVGSILADYRVIDDFFYLGNLQFYISDSIELCLKSIPMDNEEKEELASVMLEGRTMCRIEVEDGVSCISIPNNL